MRIAHGLVLASVTAGLVACSLSSVDRGTRVYVQVDTRGLEGPPRGVTAFASATPGPTTIAGFDCLAVNVTGPGIPDTSQNPEPNLGPLFDDLLNRRSYCTYRGILAGPVSAAISGPQEVSLVVPPGSPRLIQLVGLKERNGSNDCVREFNPGVAPVIGPSGVPAEADAYELGRAVVGLTGDTTVAVNADWNGLSGAEQLVRVLKCHDGVPGAINNGTIVSAAPMTVARDELSAIYDARVAPARIYVTGGTGTTNGEWLDLVAGNWTASTGGVALPTGLLAPVLLPYSTSGYINLGGATSFTGYYETSSTGASWGSNAPISPTAAVGRSARIYIAGQDATYLFGAYSSSANIVKYAHATSTITVMPTPLATGRQNGSVAILSDGKVMIAGGRGPSNPSYSCDIFDPATGTVSGCGFLAGTVGVFGGTLAPLANGDAFLIGGATGSVSGTAVSTTQAYNHTTGTWTAGNVLPEARAEAASVILPDGRVALFGGRDASGNPMNSTLFFTGTAWQHGPNLAVARYGAQAVLLPNGKVYIIGGAGVSGTPSNAVEVWSP